MVRKLRENERLGRVDDEGFTLVQRPRANTIVEIHGGGPIVVFQRDPETSKMSRTILRNKGVEKSEFWANTFRSVYHQPEFIEEDGRDIVREKVSTCVRVVEHLR